jgi:hypothetical protein
MRKKKKTIVILSISSKSYSKYNEHNTFSMISELVYLKTVYINRRTTQASRNDWR